MCAQWEHVQLFATGGHRWLSSMNLTVVLGKNIADESETTCDIGYRSVKRYLHLKTQVGCTLDFS